MDSCIKVPHSASRPLHPLDSVVIQVTRLLEAHKVLEPLDGVSDVHLGGGGVRADVARPGCWESPGVDLAEL